MSSTQQLLMSYGVTASGNQPYTAAFLTATGIADATIISALNQLEIDLTTAGLINYSSPSSNKFKALYPIVGGTASTHKYNFLDPQDTDAAFRLSFSGGWTHSSTGALPNGTNGYADTHINGSTDLTIRSTHLSYYSRTNTTTNTVEYQVYSVGSNVSFALAVNYTGLGILSDQYFPTSRIVVSNSDSRGFYVATRTDVTHHSVYKNGSVQVSDNLTTSTEALPSLNVFLACANVDGSTSAYTNRECAFASIGSGIDSTQNSNYYTAVQDFQTTLSRQV